MFLNKLRAVQFMRDHGLDALVATSPYNITYFSGYFCWLDSLFKDHMSRPGDTSALAQRYAVLTADGRTALVVGGLMAINALDLDVDDLVLVGDPGVDLTLSPDQLSSDNPRLRGLFSALRSADVSPSPLAALQAILRRYGVDGGRLGVEMEGLTPQSRKDIGPAFPQAQLKDSANLLRLVRAVKSAEEIRRLERATAIAEVAAADALSLAGPGVPTMDLLARFRNRAAEQGASVDHFAFGIHGLGIATEPNFPLAPDTLEYVDYGCTYGYYTSDSGLTLTLNPLEGVLAQRYDAVMRCMAAGESMLKPGNKASEVQAAMQESLRVDGITASFPHGHGIGLELRDYPILVPDTHLRIKDDCVDVSADLPLEEGMVLNLETPIFMPGVGSLHVEKTFVVTSGGSRSLVPQSRETPFLPAASH